MFRQCWPKKVFASWKTQPNNVSLLHTVRKNKKTLDIEREVQFEFNILVLDQNNNVWSVYRSIFWNREPKLYTWAHSFSKLEEIRKYFIYLISIYLHKLKILWKTRFWGSLCRPESLSPSTRANSVIGRPKCGNPGRFLKKTTEMVFIKTGNKLFCGEKPN